LQIHNSTASAVTVRSTIRRLREQTESWLYWRCYVSFEFWSHFDWRRFNEFTNFISGTLLVVKKVMKTDYVWQFLYGFVFPFQFNIACFALHGRSCVAHHSWLEYGYNSSVINKYIFVEHWCMIWWCGSTCPQFYEWNDHYVIKAGNLHGRSPCWPRIPWYISFPDVTCARIKLYQWILIIVVWKGAEHKDQNVLLNFILAIS